MANRWGNNGNSDRLYFGGLQNHCRWWLQWNLKTLAPWKKSCDQPRQYIKKQRHYFTNKGLSSQSYGFSSNHVWMWELDYKVEHRRIDAFELWHWWRLLKVPWTARRSNQSILKDISPEYSLEGLMLKLKLRYFGHLMQRTDSLEKTLMLGKIEGRSRRGWQRMRWLMASLTRWTWVWASFRNWWWTERPGMLQFMGLQSDMTERLNWRLSFTLPGRLSELYVCLNVDISV